MYVSLTRYAGFALAVLTGTAPATADIAIDVIDPFGKGFPTAHSCHGWEFTVTTPIILTHLGLWDQDEDGFEHAHEIGLFQVNTQSLLAFGVLSEGTVDPLTDDFRYIDVPNVKLVPGIRYVIAFHANGSDDEMLSSSVSEYAPEIVFWQGRHGGSDGGLLFPVNGIDEERIGPNFKFVVVPAPGALALLVMAGAAVRRRRS